MKSLLFAAALIVPVTALATAAMEPQQTIPRPQDRTTTSQPLFTVKFELRHSGHDAEPFIRMDDPMSQIVPPSAADTRFFHLLGVMQRDPNAIICQGWGCEVRQR
jgi:hypothetical protein